MATKIAPRGPLRGSHLRQMSTGNSSAGDQTKSADTVRASQEILAALPDALNQRRFMLSIHDDTVSKENVLLNLPPNHGVHSGEVLQAMVTNGHLSDPGQDRAIDGSPDLHFLYQPISQEVLSKIPALQISIARRMATVLGLEKGAQVQVSRVNRSKSQANHIEIAFRDQYLARADMWRLIVSELANTCVYRGQKVEFLGTVRGQIKNVFIQGRKVPSALFHSSTKPIFRSESARYVIFIQMSKEMWDFDAEGSGEIMFDKVINGFLPELFKRWQELKVRHLVSIVMFTRMTYEAITMPQTTATTLHPSKDHVPVVGKSEIFKDFYRVVVSDVACGEWADILNQLKKEFQVFLRDISIREPSAGDHLPLGEGLTSALTDKPSRVIAGYPSPASKGNILEAINLASSQFSSDYIDRDLVRTGVSIVVISPGAGVFEVDYHLLLATTENLIDNGVGIDLVCLSRMPLHSVPLFKYRPPHSEPKLTITAGTKSNKNNDDTPTGSLIKAQNPGTPPIFASNDVKGQRFDLQEMVSSKGWCYGIPHWVDISFWNSASVEGPPPSVVSKKSVDESSFDTPQHKTFVPRVRMYELQMMGVMENAIDNIRIPYLRPKFSLNAQLADPFQIAQSNSLEATPVSLMANSLGSQHHGIQLHTPYLSTSSASDRSFIPRSARSQCQWMDEYNALLFRHPMAAKRRSRKPKHSGLGLKSRGQHRFSPSPLGDDVGAQSSSRTRETNSSKQDTQSDRERIGNRSSNVKRAIPELGEGKLSDKPPRPKPGEASRQISFGPRGFSAKAVASTEITTDHSDISLISRGLKSGLSSKTRKVPNASPTNPRRKYDGHASQDAAVKSSEVAPSSESDSHQSKPIPIRNSTAMRISHEDDRKPQGLDVHGLGMDVRLQDRLATLQDLRQYDHEIPLFESNDADDLPLPVTALSPSTVLAPWLTILNPCNPSKTKAVLSSQLGRWQHVFPRPLKSSQMKWKSLCSPAAVPLTTEDFPSAGQLAEEYETTTYVVDLLEDSDVSEIPRSPTIEILAFRLSRGFQIVVGPRMTETTKNVSLQNLDVFSEGILQDVGSSIFLSRGSTIHQLSFIETNKIEVKELFRYGGEVARGFEVDSMRYKAFICSMLGQEYEPQEISIGTYRSHFDWKINDAFIAGHGRPQAHEFVESLRPWRARFVLIPVDATSSARRRQRLDEDDEEEVRLEGIRKLTQVWQRFRYIPPGERRYQFPSRERKDTNPLDIMYQTRNPSAIVAAELDNVAEGDSTGQLAQLLPESDLYQRSNFKIAGLAETIQSDKGVRMLDRRWHLRLHYNCFIGFELTSWLLQNFRDVDTRDEAVDLGNELMKSGMFKHVEQRHNFRDGNYFYQIADEYRTPRPESRGWFGRTKASVPSTPMSEEVPKQPPITGRSRSSSSGSAKEEDDPSTPTGNRRQLSVALSKSLIYDVDHRKRSYRPELINLHYDRLHNPDNCYHIRIEWMNTTPKLIQDAVASWATSVERFGLRLVEVPLGEASSITSMHPFRAPYVIKLSHRPPQKQPQSYFANTSFAPLPKTEKNFYQKAIMKRFNFVLDFEAASDFPSDVDVKFSWGKPDYRYPQYVHRSGMLIAQITDDGDFLILANRLYNNRSTTSSSTYEAYRTDHNSEGDLNRGPGFFRSSPYRGSHAPTRPSPHGSPCNSPSIRATLDIPASVHNSRGPSPTSSTPKHSDPTRPNTSASALTPEAITREFEAFCHDAEVLTIFYDEVLSRASTPGPNTPFIGSKTPSKAPGTPSNESNIPTLALPRSVVGKSSTGNGDSQNVDADTRIIG